MQPKVMVPVGDKALVSAPDVIIKTEGARYPGLSANEWMCLTAARHAGLAVPRFDLSADGHLLVLDRFDILSDGSRLGFEDMAAVMQLRVRDRLSSRKYIGSYEDITAALCLVCTDPAAALAQFSVIWCSVFWCAMAMPTLKILPFCTTTNVPGIARSTTR